MKQNESHTRSTYSFGIYVESAANEAHALHMRRGINITIQPLALPIPIAKTAQ
jgi:hypothetical protein